MASDDATAVWVRMVLFIIALNDGFEFYAWHAAPRWSDGILR